MVTKEGEHPVHEGEGLVVAEVQALDEHACALVVVGRECAEKPGFETLVLLRRVWVGHGLDVVESPGGDILGQGCNQVGVRTCSVQKAKST